MAWRSRPSVGLWKLRLAERLPVVGSMKPALSGALAGLLVGVVVQAAPQPAPAPKGMREHTVTLRELAVRVQVLEGDAWDWRAFERCIHREHIRLVAGASVPVTWRSQCLQPARKP